LETCRTIAGLADFIAERYASAAEIGIGHCADIARELQKRGMTVFATDIREFLHHGVVVLLDSVISPDIYLYVGVDLIYSMRPPPELVPYIAGLAKTVSADVIIKPLYSEYPEGWRSMKYRNTTFFIRKYRNEDAASEFEEQ
jgi:hypothetical protein